MICYRDMTFCDSDCTNRACRRHFGPDDGAAAIRWWGGEDAPVAWADFTGDCPDYVPPNAAKGET